MNQQDSPTCYCQCHQATSSRPSCEHCQATKPNNIDPLDSLLDAYDEAMDVAANRLLMDREGYDSYVQEARAEAKVALELLMVQERLEALEQVIAYIEVHEHDTSSGNRIFSKCVELRAELRRQLNRED